MHSYYAFVFVCTVNIIPYITEALMETSVNVTHASCHARKYIYIYMYMSLFEERHEYLYGTLVESAL